MNTPTHRDTPLTETYQNNPSPFTPPQTEGKSMSECPGELLDSGFELTELLMD
jgi:hypothetical protein